MPAGTAARRRFAGAAAFLAMILLLLIANRGAYEGYFQDDELDNISWTRAVPLHDFAAALASPEFYVNNFRPAGHFFFHLMERAAGLEFPPYVRAVHALHFLNVWLVWLVLRRFELPAPAAGAGSLFFAFHMALFDAYWKPMYVFDLLCATFSLLSILFYQRRRWVPSFLALWLAYKSKEPAVMLPAVLAAYEYWFSTEHGKRRWLRLAPFFAVSLCFGLQALLHRPADGDTYAMSFSPFSVATTLSFYARHVLLVPYAGFALFALPFFVHDRRVSLGLFALLALLTPVLLLPGRMFSAYLYLPMTGLALAFAAVAARVPPAALAAFFLLWLPFNYIRLRENRRAALTVAQENRAYTEALLDKVAPLTDTRIFVFDGSPKSMNRWGIEGILRYAYREQIPLYRIGEPGADAKTAGNNATLLVWDPQSWTLDVVSRRTNEPLASFIRMMGPSPVWQLREGWYGRSGHFRWTRPSASAVLFRPAGARQFEVVVNAGPEYMKIVGHVTLEAAIDGLVIGRREFRESGWRVTRWDLPPAPPGDVTVTFRADPPCCPGDANPKALGIPIGAFGFRMGGEPLEDAVPAAARNR